ncbi:hypothetical protein [Bacillus sp. AK031]
MKEYLTIQEHAWKLCLVFEAIHIQTCDDRWVHISEWLQMASGVRSVEIDTQYYNTSNLFCGVAMDYEDSRSKLWSDFCVELTTFNFLWGSLESLIEEITPATETDSKPSFGKIFLKENYKGSPINKYICELDYLKKLVSYSNFASMDKILNKRVIRTKNSGTGLHIVSKLRNLFAHGAVSLPHPDEFEDQVKINLSVIRHSSRIVLLTIQMLLIAFFRKDDLILEHLEMFDEISDFGHLKVTVLLEHIHLYNYSKLLSNLSSCD